MNQLLMVRNVQESKSLVLFIVDFGNTNLIGKMYKLLKFVNLIIKVDW
jgi:hypothetical protein